MTKTHIYLPKVRTNSYPQNKELRSYASDGSSTMLPNPAIDDIAANNIACQEFDYTESLADEGANILPDDNNMMAHTDTMMSSEYEEYNIMPDDKIEGDK